MLVRASDAGESPKSNPFIEWISNRGHNYITRFSETEAVAILAVLIARYRVELKEEPQFAHETFEQRKERILRCKPGITLTYVPGSRFPLPCI